MLKCCPNSCGHIFHSHCRLWRGNDLVHTAGHQWPLLLAPNQYLSTAISGREKTRNFARRSLNRKFSPIVSGIASDQKLCGLLATWN